MALHKKNNFSAAFESHVVARSSEMAEGAIQKQLTVRELTKSLQTPSPTSVTSAPTAAISHKEVLEGCKRLLTSPATPKKSSPKKIQSVIAQPPLLYLGIILRRPPNQDPSKPFSWGISMIKERSHVHVVGINPTSASVKFCRVSSIAPAKSIVYNLSHQQNFESNFINHFPPSWRLSSSNSPSILAPSMQLGDAIISINGVPISSFENITAVATYIRNNCQRQLIMVAIRHHSVWRAGWNEMAKKVKAFPNITRAKTTEQKVHQQVLQRLFKEKAAKEKKERVTKAIREEWGRIQRQSYSKSVRRMIDKNAKERMKSNVMDRLFALADTRELFNPAFRDSDGNFVIYSDNGDVDPEDGKRFRQFVTGDVNQSFGDWLKVRKVSWRGKRKNVYMADAANDDREESSTIHHDFWLACEYESFDQWLSASKAKWRRSYSWHKDKKMKLQSETEKQVYFPSADLITSHASSDVALAQFNDWLGVRKQQWRVTRRKRQLDRAGSSANCIKADAPFYCDRSNENASSTSHTKSRKAFDRHSSSNDTMIIDEILEEQQRQVMEQEIEHAPLDISWIFDSDVGAPDDVIVLLMRFLNPSDHGNLLCLSWASNYSFKKRDALWQSLCPKRWLLPRRPRKSWCSMYITKIRAEEEASRKQSDDLLTKADAIINKGDNLIKFQKLIRKAEKDFSLDVNYTSGTVLERNSLLNTAVINQRKNIVKWLVEEKHCDIETCDRGGFTPLLNAAWNGDKHLVRYLLGKGADRKKIGTFHSSKGIANKEFEGRNAEGWARERGHAEVADLIHIGL